MSRTSCRVRGIIPNKDTNILRTEYTRRKNLSTLPNTKATRDNPFDAENGDDNVVDEEAKLKIEQNEAEMKVNLLFIVHKKWFP